MSRSAPDRVAVVAGGRSVTYGELESETARLAAVLTEEGVSRGSVVAVYSERNADAIVWLVAIMRSGAAYTVVEDDGRLDENGTRLTLLKANLVLCAPSRMLALREKGLRAFAPRAMDRERGARRGPVALPPGDATAYVLYTSGSTGVPKGVAVTHANLAHYTEGIASRLGIPLGLRYAHVSTLAADLGNTSLFLAFWTGGCLHLVDALTRKDPAALREYLVTNAIDFLKITPTHWRAVFPGLKGGTQGGVQLRYLFLGGEVLSTALARDILNSGVVGRLVNHYGPTETTVGVTVYPIESMEQLTQLNSESVPIGKPFGSTVLRVRGDDGVFREKGGRGELYVGGPSVSLGYLGDAASTAKSFVTIDGLRPSERFYKTGDLVTIDDHGLVSFLGRGDRQVKINGNRVELEHVESVARTLVGVRDAAAYLLETRGRTRLVMAIVSGGAAGASDDLRERLLRLLPEYMIPAIFVEVAEFPRNENGKTDVKALRATVVERLAMVDAARPDATCGPGPAAPALVDEVRRLWRRYVRAETFGDDDDFFALGGDSLDAIQLIADLQSRGHVVTAHAFLRMPTIRGLLAALTSPAPTGDSAREMPVAETVRSLSAAQAFFFRQRFPEEDHYNQAVLLECERRLDAEALGKAIVALVAAHPSLRTRYTRDEHGVSARRVDMREHAILTVSTTGAGTSEAALRAEIERTAQGVQQSMSLAAGRLIRAHLFRVLPGRDQLLLVAHHAAVDLISWRILVSDLGRAYADALANLPGVLPCSRTSFWNWVDHLDAHKESLLRRGADWLEPARRRALAAAATIDEHNTEGTAGTAWLHFSADETRLLLADVAIAAGAPLHVLVLAAFAHCLGRSRNLTELAVDVESHGRVTLDDTTDISRTAGWHTSTFPVFIDVAGRAFPDIVADVTASLRQVPELGVAYGLAGRDAPADQALPVAPICYNYLGDLHFGGDDRFPVLPSPYSIGRARGDRNGRLYDLKLSARILRGSLIADLSFPGATDAAEMSALMADVRRTLLGTAARDTAGPRVLIEAGTRTGILGYVPPQLLTPAATPATRDYRAVLITGATGYVGVHVLRELLTQTQAHVHCVVRTKNGRAAYERLRRCYEAYFPEQPLATFRDRLTVMEGDVSQKEFGLAAELYDRLSTDVDAIYHLAADTRLFGKEEDFVRQNVLPVETCIAFATGARPKDIHYMSTLAVSGVNPRAETIAFSEDSFDVGQEFQNHYESTKYMAERTLRRFETTGGRVFIYRSGNVSGDSRTGRFQMNAYANRFVQFLAVCVKVGALPRHLGAPIALSPVDQVASGVVGISVDPTVPGGVFHVDTTYEVPMDKIFGALQRSGIQFRITDHPTFDSLFSATADRRDPDLALGMFWASRRSRNVRFDNERTHRILERMARPFTPLADEWVSKFINSLALTGIFASSVFGPEFAPSLRDMAQTNS